jgi:NhaP-type Na+/H+ and K+/H+ antiporter
MYQNAAILAVFLLIYSAPAGRIERSWLSGPIVIIANGLLLGPDGLGLVRLDFGAGGLPILAELTLVMVLFSGGHPIPRQDSSPVQLIACLPAEPSGDVRE